MKKILIFDLIGSSSHYDLMNSEIIALEKKYKVISFSPILINRSFKDDHILLKDKSSIVSLIIRVIQFYYYYYYYKNFNDIIVIQTSNNVQLFFMSLIKKYVIIHNNLDRGFLSRFLLRFSFSNVYLIYSRHISQDCKFKLIPHALKNSSQLKSLSSSKTIYVHNVKNVQHLKNLIKTNSDYNFILNSKIKLIKSHNVSVVSDWDKYLEYLQLSTAVYYDISYNKRVSGVQYDIISQYKKIITSSITSQHKSLISQFGDVVCTDLKNLSINESTIYNIDLYRKNYTNNICAQII